MRPQFGRRVNLGFLLITGLAIGAAVLVMGLLGHGANSDDRPRPEVPPRATPSTYEPPDPNRYRVPHPGTRPQPDVVG